MGYAVAFFVAQCTFLPNTSGAEGWNSIVFGMVRFHAGRLLRGWFQAWWDGKMTATMGQRSHPSADWGRST